jgi:ABC-type amino acid transport substrate-binding protein
MLPRSLGRYLLVFAVLALASMLAFAACDDDEEEEGAKSINIVTFDTNPLAVEDLRTGGSDANFSDFPVAAEDAAQSEGELEVVEPQIDPEPYGVGIRKGSTELKDAIADAIQAIRDSGEYDQILAKWGLEAVALESTAEEAPAAIDISGVPELEDGVLNVGSDIAYAPFEFFQEGTEIADGLDVDMGKAIAEVLGVEAEFINTGWDGIIPALQTEDFDVIMSAMTITDERSQEIDFVAYISVGTGIVVPAGNPDNIQDLDDLCGLTVAVQVGTIQEQILTDQNEQCD